MNTGGEAKRVLLSSTREAMWQPGDEAAERQLDAISAGTMPRETGTDFDDFVRMVKYTDPVDGSIRYAVEFEQPNGEFDVEDYSDSAKAEAAYEAMVRSQAQVGYLYTDTDVEGVPTRKRDQ
jgi:hypothetical protein